MSYLSLLSLISIGLAILLGEVETLKILLELGSNPNLANAFDGNHPLVILAKLRSEENSKTPTLAKILLEAGSDPICPVRYQADAANRLDATQTPSCHESPLFCCGKFFFNSHSKVSLSILVRFQNEELLKICLEKGVDINAINPENGSTPLMLAAERGYQNICDMLIDAGANVSASDFLGNTPLHVAAQGYGEQTSIIQTLIQRGADRKAINDDGYTPAMIAKRIGKDDYFKLLDVKTDDLVHKSSINSESDNIKEQNVFSFT